MIRRHENRINILIIISYWRVCRNWKCISICMTVHSKMIYFLHFAVCIFLSVPDNDQFFYLFSENDLFSHDLLKKMCLLISFNLIFERLVLSLSFVSVIVTILHFLNFQFKWKFFSALNYIFPSESAFINVLTDVWFGSFYSLPVGGFGLLYKVLVTIATFGLVYVGVKVLWLDVRACYIFWLGVAEWGLWK